MTTKDRLTERLKRRETLTAEDRKVIKDEATGQTLLVTDALTTEELEKRGHAGRT
jgi:hypothetical protein